MDDKDLEFKQKIQAIYWSINALSDGLCTLYGNIKDDSDLFIGANRCIQSALEYSVTLILQHNKEKNKE